jgi:hypothetical protein
MISIFFKKNRIKILIAGPNLVILPSENNKLLFSNYVDKILVPSNWVKKLYLNYNKNYKKISTWFSGVAIPSKKNSNKKLILIYLKKENNFYDDCIKFLLMKNTNF